MKIQLTVSICSLIVRLGVAQAQGMSPVESTSQASTPGAAPQAVEPPTPAPDLQPPSPPQLPPAPPVQAQAQPETQQPAPAGEPGAGVRYGLVVSRKNAGNAVRRNKIRRRMREGTTNWPLDVT